MRHNWDGGWGVGTWLLMGFGMLVFWALVVAGIVWLVHSATGKRNASGAVRPDEPAGQPQLSARDILDVRYARGEIDDEEYRTRRDTLATR
jgi:putative membrane protein